MYFFKNSKNQFKKKNKNMYFLNIQKKQFLKKKCIF